jgi:hypothetical protein
MDETEPAMGSAHRSHKCVGVCVVVCLAETGEEECYCVQREGGEPGTEDVGEDLECSSER